MAGQGWRALCATVSVSVAVFAGAMAPPASADESLAHLFFGTELSVRNQFVYSGAIIAPAGGLDQPGWRFRAYGGTGRYRLDDGTWVDKQTGHGLIGWAHWNDAGGVTLYAGIAAERHDAAPTQSKHGTEAGAAVLAEAWRRLDPATLVSASLGYADVYETLSGRIAMSRTLNARFDLVGEARGGHDSDGTYWAIGAGVTAHVSDVDATLVAGASGDENRSGFSVRAEISTRR